jgi:HipA-like protein
MSRLHILMDGRHLGYLDGRGRAVRVAYDRDVDPARVVPLSMSMPLAGSRYRGAALGRWLSALLPDRPTVLMRWRRDFGITDDHPESLLAHIGEDVARYVGPTTFELKMDADAWLSMMQASMTEHRWKPPVPFEDEPESPTLREYSATWLRNRRTRYGEGLKPRTVHLYRGCSTSTSCPSSVSGV